MTVTDISNDVRRLDSRRAIQQFIDELTTAIDKWQGLERRAEPRHAIALPVKVTPFDGATRQFGETFQAVTRDVSTRELSILCPHQFAADLILLEFLQPERCRVQVGLKVRRCRPLGPFWDVAGRFID